MPSLALPVCYSATRRHEVCPFPGQRGRHAPDRHRPPPGPRSASHGGL